MSPPLLQPPFYPGPKDEGGPDVRVVTGVDTSENRKWVGKIEVDGVNGLSLYKSLCHSVD